MNSDTISCLNFIVHSLVIGAFAWLLVRFVIRDALRRCILANLAVLMCLYTPFDISFRDLLPKQAPVPVWTPIQETFKADWRITVTPAAPPTAVVTPQAPARTLNDLIRLLRHLSWLITGILWLRLASQSIRVQRWAWRLRRPSLDELEKLPDDLDLARIRVFDHAGSPCVAGWFFPVIAVPATAFERLTPHQWRWLLRHEGEHLRLHDTFVVCLQNIVRSFLWWNPFAHALTEEYARAREEACDAAAVGEERDHAAYADFLLTWAAHSAPQSACVMPIAHSRPARRLKARLVALMEARGVRKKLGALFVLACLAFLSIAPLIAASFGIATASAQEAAKPQEDEGAMYTRLYKVSPDFLNGDPIPSDPFAAGKEATTTITKKSARQILELQGIPFPAGASAIFNPVTSQLIVRHHKGALNQIEAIIDRLSKRPPLVYFQCKLIMAESYFGAHEAILRSDEATDLWRQLSQKKGMDLASMPSVTMQLGQEAIAEVVREVFPEKLPEKGTTSVFKFIGPSIKLHASAMPNGKAQVTAKIDLGVDPQATHSWLPQKGDKPDWNRVQIHTVAGQAELASGETLVLHLQTSKKPVTVLITAEALNPQGQKAVSFESTATVRPSTTGIDVPDKVVSEWSVRVYKVPSSFPLDKPPVAVLEAAGIPFSKPADAALKDGKLTVRQTRPNLDLIEAWLDSLHQATVKKRVVVTVQAAEAKGDFLKLMEKWLPTPPGYQKPVAIRDPLQLSNIDPAPSEAILRQFTTAGIFTKAQFEVVTKRAVKAETLKPKSAPADKEQRYELPALLGGGEVSVESHIGADGNTIEFIVANDPGTPKRISTGVAIWGGQTFVLASQPSPGVSRFLFVTGSIEEEEGKK
ncbi:M56 family metallopeptidase [Prosthecobacter sp.]|uniref:M56 family metallopeptidase n=1 Tax=Prosthecobacter sp. TaxID=1965333 RepID=UPI003784030C